MASWGSQLDATDVPGPLFPQRRELVAHAKPPACWPPPLLASAHGAALHVWPMVHSLASAEDLAAGACTSHRPCSSGPALKIPHLTSVSRAQRSCWSGASSPEAWTRSRPDLCPSLAFHCPSSLVFFWFTVLHIGKIPLLFFHGARQKTPWFKMYYWIPDTTINWNARYKLYKSKAKVFYSTFWLWK